MIIMQNTVKQYNIITTAKYISLDKKLKTELKEIIES